ncbi:MAG: NDP-hexose 2,3-dehydratase family protein [Gammaproteobacteria bacterium]|nr:NDP-hexose 2,3-dehydratase family protein [Gammaproteobacteria bacterium]MCF6337250.1 NDP-hexose 2,3-dehydratase family protein [Gammaproteobacteria bacterium]
MKYQDCVSEFTRYLKEECPEVVHDLLRIETQVESWFDWSQIATLAQVIEWYETIKNNCNMTIEEIKLDDCRGWHFNNTDGWIKHESGEFFMVQGLRISQSGSREVGSGGWDQPILTQVGLDGGLLGILRKRIKGVPHYLLEAKAEPGNPDLVQISPTLQATFSNLRCAHKGRRPLFADLFEHPEKTKSNVLFDQWMSEDGGRLYKKRNKGLLVEVDKDYEIEDRETFQWFSLWQIKQLIKTNSWVNPHVRGIISHL